MPVLDPVRTLSPASSRSAHAGARPSSFVFLRDLDDPRVLEVREASNIDRYDARLLGLAATATSVVFSFYGESGVVLPAGRPAWEAWLPEVDARVALPEARPQSVISEQIEEIQRVTGLSDGQLAAAFPGRVTRETINRWRNRPDPNLRPENLYRLGILHELAERIEAGGMNARVWLHQHVRGTDRTPYDLICAGQLGDVRRAVESIAAGAAPAAEPMPFAPISREHDVVTEEAEDDEGEWTWEESDGDAGA